MWPRIAIVIGLVTGVAAAALIGGVLVLAPEGLPEATARPTVPPGVVNPSTGPSVGPASPPASASPATPPAPSGSGGSVGLFHIGEPAPALVVPQVGGGTIDLAGLRGTPVWVNFMATYCLPCRDEFPRMNGFAAGYADADLVVLAIDVEEDEGAVASFAESLDAIFPLGLDRDGSAAERWGAVALPVHFWIDREGIVRDGALGGIGPDIMARGLATILPGVDVTP
jgi:cytochrome c biogenesis protein CcmG/thiol:disulfide interchange protein DsbE